MMFSTYFFFNGNAIIPPAVSDLFTIALAAYFLLVYSISGSAVVNQSVHR